MQSKQELAQIKPENTSTLLGLFSDDHMKYEAERGTTEEPSLTDMTVKALELLSTKEDGFFLMVEAARIDHAHHANKAAYAIMDTDALDKSVDAALKLLQGKGLLDETLIIVAADHSHVVTFSGQSARGTPVLGLVKDTQGQLKQGKDNKPYTLINYSNGPAAKLRKADPPMRRELSVMETMDINFLQPALFNRHDSSETHGGEDVSMYARGPGAHHFTGNMEQNAIFHAINKAADLGAQPYVIGTEE